MEIKATLQKPYTEEDRIDFIVTYNHNQGYVIEETETELQALGYTADELEQQERERIQELSMTRGDLFEALILAQGVGKAQLRAMIENFEGLTELERALYLNRFDEALDFYRKHPAIDLVGGLLGITPENMDKFFDTKDYMYLISIPDVNNLEELKDQEPVINGDTVG